jgi:hypothetical protein
MQHTENNFQYLDSYNSVIEVVIFTCLYLSCVVRYANDDRVGLLKPCVFFRTEAI